MRVAIFVAVVAAHIVLLWLFPSLRRWVLQPGEDAASVLPVMMPPLPPDLMVEPIAEADAPTSWKAPLLYRSAPPKANRAITQRALEASRRRPRREDARQAPASRDNTDDRGAAADVGAAAKVGAAAGTSPNSQQSPPATATSPAPDWHAQAAITGQSSAQHIVAAEDLAARQAAALTANFKPLPGPRVAAPKFGWDETPMHRISPIENGFIIPLTDHCAIVLLITPMIGCSIGEIPVNGDLFKNMHGPVKFGDWDWRLADP